MFNIQQDFFNIIMNEINNGKLSHAYLIETNDYSQVDLFLDRFIKLLLCPDHNVQHDCLKCKLCKLIDNRNFPDLKIIDPVDSWIKKEQLLDIKADFANRSVFNNKQIYVIKDASKLNSYSANTMLKFLEEPEENIIAILLTKNRYNVIETILSRCQVFSLKSDDVISFGQETTDLIKLLFIKDKGFLNYNSIMDLIPDKRTAKNQFSLIEKYFFHVVNNKMDLFTEIAYLNSENVYKIILILEKYLNDFEFNLNYKLSIDHFLVEIDEVIS